MERTTRPRAEAEHAEEWLAVMHERA